MAKKTKDNLPAMAGKKKDLSPGKKKKNPAPVKVAVMGRPTIYNQAVIDELCQEISTSTASLVTICKSDKYPSVAIVIRWLSDGKHPDFVSQYTLAKQIQAEFLAEQIIEIADDSGQDTVTRFDAQGRPYKIEDKEWTNRSRLRVDARKWVAAKLLPKKYGDSSKIDLTVKTEQPLFPDEKSAEN